MKNIWKWILGILIVLVILTIPLALYFGNQLVRGFDARGPVMDHHAWDPHGSGRGFHAPMGLRGGFGFFGPLRLLGGLVRWAFFGALLYGAYWLGRRNARVVLEPRPIVPTPPPASPPTTPDRDNITKSE